MAPFLTHLAVGERVWDRLGEHSPTGDAYGTFLFGCLAPDVDKLCDGLEQGTTHFVSKEEGPSYMWQRTERFLAHQTDFLRAPFRALDAREQAFVMGYVCHVATDESTARLALSWMEQVAAKGKPVPQVDALLTTLDPCYWAMAHAPERVVTALEDAEIPNDTLTFAPEECLQALYQIILPQVKEGGGLEPYLRMVRRQWRWTRHGQVSDATDDPGLEAELATYRRRIEADLPSSERWIEAMDLGLFMSEAVDYSVQQIQALVAKERNQ